MARNKLYYVIILLYIQVVYTRKLRREFFTRKQRPNIIFVMADDLDTVLGSPQVMRKTKRLLQDEGVTFENAFTTSPICCPSRSSILTGRYSHNHHVTTNTKNCYGEDWIHGPEKANFGKLMQDAGYKTAYFGKYLNNYDGERIPDGWNYWSALVRNSRFYNYTLNVNGKLVKHKNNYKKDYFTDTMTTASLNYFSRMKRGINSPPVMMVLSMAAPHGPEDAAPQYQKAFENITAPRFPNFNFTSPDKHWIVRRTPPLDSLRVKFIDTLYRKRLQTLLSVDDAIERLYIMLMKTRQLDNTYIVFSSDHGYHLGQFNQVKGKAQPYESDVRIPLYIRGPKIPRGVTVSEIALNIDFVPTFLDIANTRPPKFIDGTSLMDVAVGNVINKAKGKVLKPIWKDTFMITRGKMIKLPPTLKPANTSNIEQLDFPTITKVQKICSKQGHPKPPCTPEKKFVCYTKGNTWYLERCAKGDRRKSVACTCPIEQKGLPSDFDMSMNSTNNEIEGLLLQLERQFERLKRRIKRHGVKYFDKLSVADNEKPPDYVPSTVKPAIEKEDLVPIEELDETIKLENPESKVKMGVLVDRKIKKSQQRLEYWQKERSKLALNRELTKKLALTLADRVRELQARQSLRTTTMPDGIKTKTPCYCNTGQSKSSTNMRQSKSSTNKYSYTNKYKNKKISNKKKKNIGMNCFTVHKNHWKNPPLWKDKPLTACTNSANNTFWCARTINKTHNFLYCEFVTGFKEYFDVNRDPFQLENIIHKISLPVQSDLSRLISHLKVCKGANNCFVRAGETLADRKDVLKKMRRFERKKRHGIFVRGDS